MKKVDLGILISSCDRYADLWDPFFFFFKKYWPDCPYPLYLVANTYSSSEAIPLFVTGSTWSQEMESALEKFPHEYFLYLQDDYFLNKRVNNLEVFHMLQVISLYAPAYFRLFPHRGPKKGVLIEEGIQYIDKGEPYTCSLQAAIWEKKAFLRLLDFEENIWQFEINSAIRSLDLKAPFLSIVWQKDLPRDQRRYPINYFCTAVRKGKWRRDAIAFCLNEGYSISVSRPIETFLDRLKKKIYDYLPLKLQILFAKKFFGGPNNLFGLFYDLHVLSLLLINFFEVNVTIEYALDSIFNHIYEND